jgi:hypothetical protein
MHSKIGISFEAEGSCAGVLAALALRQLPIIIAAITLVVGGSAAAGAGKILIAMIRGV